MNHWSDDILEFGELKRLLRRYVASPLGAAELEAVSPVTERFALEELLAQTGEAIEYLRASSHPQPASRGAAIRLRFDGLPEAAPITGKLRIEGTVLEAAEILALSGLLDRACDVRATLSACRARFPRLAAIASGIGDFSEALREVTGKILPDGTISDQASPLLRRLRHDVDRQQKHIQDSLERFLRSHRDEGVLQEEFVAIRNERFVVPVVAGKQRRVEGVIHGTSGSGHTLFIEPLETIQLNNELVRLREEEQRECHRVLRKLTAALRACSGEVAGAVRVLGELEWLFAKADFALDFDCVVPRFCPPAARRLTLERARHPLLADVLRRRKRPIVPVTLQLDEKARTLLISGPNTGGKTVALKTAGLLALMAQSALPVPCADAELPLFDQVLADIGDNQSIQESLSTFSAHIERVRDMAELPTRDSLVLLDELGRATDPEEGGALGVALLEHFRGAGAFTLASTHLLALKVYGANTEGVLNASMGFDEQTLQPTYQLRVGAPGKSAGLDIAERLGLPERLIQRARSAMTSSQREIAQFLSELDQRLQAATSLEQELRTRSEALEKRREELTGEWATRETAKLREIEARAAALMASFERQTQEVIGELYKSAQEKKDASRARQQAARARRQFGQQISAALRPDAAQAGAEVPRLEAGALVRVRNIREPARVRRLLGADLVEVEAGLVKLQVSVDDVVEVLEAKAHVRALPAGVRILGETRSEASLEEINVIGKRAEEACSEVDKFLDTAVMAGVIRVRIVHGHGMGILRKAIGELLAAHPHVERFQSAPANEGGTGATIAELRAV